MSDKIKIFLVRLIWIGFLIVLVDQYLIALKESRRVTISVSPSFTLNLTLSIAAGFEWIVGFVFFWQAIRRIREARKKKFFIFVAWISFLTVAILGSIIPIFSGAVFKIHQIWFILAFFGFLITVPRKKYFEESS